ncbi:MAG: YkgJ family cysteine cluster protein [Planctomycetes bacterium]|nr:YkgJ family cysteine cluster protein [Planctomycetota bacterium]MCB9920503.1 YkgJ family cysteine cluster protein [Planctomycetota bacterium]
MSSKNGKKSTKRVEGSTSKTLEQRVRDQPELEQFLRHLSSVSIDLDDEELDIESTLPDKSFAFGNSNVSYSRSFDLTDHPALREAVKNLVSEIHNVAFKADPEYDPNRCDRCVKSDCCSIDRIHLTEAERLRILDHLGERDSKATSAKYFEFDDDLGGFYKHIMRHTNGACSFLKPIGPGGMMRCSIYAVRPNVCREYDPGYCTEATKLKPKRAHIQV